MVTDTRNLEDILYEAVHSEMWNSISKEFLRREVGGKLETWNVLPQKVIEATSNNAFKYRLYRVGCVRAKDTTTEPIICKYVVQVGLHS